MAYYTTLFAASLMTTAVIVLLVLVGGGHLGTSLGAPICGDTPATDQASFAGYVHDVHLLRQDSRPRRHWFRHGH
ncbi:unnamed protein product [Linum trigynum]|uniref:Secreted protein n=1 Tax=Linum trigynum TaxID=586398 RepID=A0AAV2GEG0_9ROSI